ncbi:MAG: hypothetical protein Q4P29_03350 [Tissierellia bacterium]|nr:hypothetical protein [Tissierellia bacterium]
MKKKLILALALVLLAQTGCSSTNAAENKNETEKIAPIANEDEKPMPKGVSKEYTKEELVKIAKKAFDIPDDFKEVQIDSNEDERGKVYNINWNDPDSDRNASVNIASTGEPLSYYSYDGTENRTDDLIKPSFPYEHGAQLAKDSLYKILGEKADFFRLDETISGEIDRYNKTYHYRFNKYVNDIKVQTDGIIISLDINSAKIREYDLNSSVKYDLYDLSHYAAPKDIVDNDDAWITFREYNPLLLNLKRIVDLKTKTLFPEPKYIPTYEFADAHIIIDAKTGKPEKRILYHGYDLVKEGAAPAEMPKGGLTAIEQEEIENTNVKVSPEEAEKLAREIANIDKSVKLQNIRLGKYNQNEKKQLWSMQFENDENHITVDIDANDKTLLGMNKNRFSREDEIDISKIDSEKSIQIAKEFAKKYAADILDKLEMTASSKIPEDGNLNFIEFIRKLDENYYLIQDRISIGINPKNYEVVSFSRSFYDDIKVPNEKIINLDKAYDILYDNIDFELNYVLNNDRNKMELKYVLDPKEFSPLIISAKDGQFLDWKGTPISAKISGYEDIENAENKDEIELLSRYGIKYLQTKLEPKKIVLQKDFLTLLMTAEGNYYSDTEDFDLIYEYAIRNGIIEKSEESRDRKLTRKDIAKYLIRYKDIEEIAKLEGVFKDVYKDANGDANLIIVGKLGWIDAKGDKILPNEEVTREEALMIFYNMLFK